MKNKKEKKKTNFNYSEEFITSTPNPTEQELKNVCLGAVILNNHYITNPLVRVVLYLRLSDEDRDKLTSDQISKSIKNQELMLREYAENEGFKIVGVYNDEDWSGADSSRPNFNKMIDECKVGNVDIVLCKT